MKPEKLRLFIGGYFGGSYGVELERGALLYTRWREGSDNEEPRRIAPSAEAWTVFWERLDEAGVWSWSGSYQNPGILDGTSWSIVIAVGERSVEARGSNAYPCDALKASASTKSRASGTRFDDFWDAVSELLGGCAFR